MVGGVRLPHYVGKVQTNSLAHAFPRAIFVALLPLSFFTCAFRHAGADLGVAPASAKSGTSVQARRLIPGFHFVHPGYAHFASSWLLAIRHAVPRLRRRSS